MPTPNDFDLYAGLSGLELPEDPIEFGNGIAIRKASARFSRPFTLVNTKLHLTPKGELPVTQWQLGDPSGSDVVAELLIPASFERDAERRFETARIILFALRLMVDPSITLQVISSHPFDSLIELNLKGCKLYPVEVQQRHFSMSVVNRTKVLEGVHWVSKHWLAVHRLYTASAEFRLAADALDLGQFIPNSALALVSLMGAIEAIFSPSTAELKFRVSALVAAYLCPPGEQRLTQQKKVATLYDKRSAAAHGKPQHQAEDLLETFELLRRILLKIIQDGHVPSKESLEANLFGAPGG